MNGQHSPGPWSHSPGGLLMDADGKFLATAWQALAPEAEAAYPTEAQFRTNAALMSLAPSLYAALLFMVEASAEGCDPTTCNRCREAYDKASALLAKVSVS